jgi:hypothetical protein
MITTEIESCDFCEAEGPGSSAWGGLCHDCDNQMCPECGDIKCEHEF